MGADRMAAGRMAAGRMAAGRMEAGRMAAGRMAAYLSVWMLMVLIVVMGSSETAAVNESSSVFLSTDDDVSQSSHYENDFSDGGFPSLDGMLHWAIGHSDPEKLRETSDHVRRLSPSDLNNRQQEIQDLLERLKMPSDTQLMQIAIHDLNNVSLSFQDHRRALDELLILVEPIDNANALEKLGDFTAIIRALDSSDPEVRISSAWLLGKSSQNNPVVQNQILSHGVLAKLMNMTQSKLVEEAGKALYAISALVRNNLDGQDLFYTEGGDVMLQGLMSNPSVDTGLRKKAIVIVADLVVSELEARNRKELTYFSNGGFLKAVVDLMASSDIDLQEKALVAMKNLLQLEKMEGVIVKEDCGLETALERMRQELEKLMLDEEQRDYAMDVESLRREVEFIFHGKLGKVSMDHQTPNLKAMF